MCRTFLAWEPGGVAIYTHMKYDVWVHQLHEFTIFTSSQDGNERWQLMSKFVQFTSVHFSDLNPNFHGNLKNIKLDLAKLLAKCLHQGQI